MVLWSTLPRFLPIAGKRAGLEGDRSSLVSEVFRLIRETPEEYRPQYILYENVKGMLSSNKGFDYLEILYQMAALGYDTEREMPNSKDFGVPQNRERVFTIGHLRGRSTGKVFPLEYEINGYSTVGKSTKTAVARTLTAGGHSGGNHSGMTIIKCVGNLIPNGNKNNSIPGRVYDVDGLSPCLRTPTGGGTIPIITDYEYLRRLTPCESWRLQGIPEHITEKVIQAGISDTQMYRGAGDACTKDVIYEIAKKLT